LLEGYIKTKNYMEEKSKEVGNRLQELLDSEDEEFPPEEHEED
jgi:hypothetical protein